MTPYYEHGGITIYLGDCREMVAAKTLRPSHDRIRAAWQMEDEMKIDTRLQESLVKAIVGKLFENGQGQKAERLVLELPGKIDGGGWSKQAVAAVICSAINDL